MEVPFVLLKSRITHCFLPAEPEQKMLVVRGENVSEFGNHS